MIDPTQNQANFQARALEKTKKKQVDKVSRAVSSEKSASPKQSMVDSILAKMKAGEDVSDPAVQREYIIKTLEALLGKRSVGSPKFKELVEKIEAALQTRTK